jgi:hypothetical protein
LEGFRDNGKVLNAIYFVRSKLPAQFIPKLPEFTYKLLNPHPEDESDVSEDDDEEAKNASAASTDSEQEEKKQ